MRRVTIGSAALVLALLLPGGTAAPATQLDANEAPDHEGPLTLSDTRCDRKTRKNEGEVVAVIKRCLFFYRFDESAEGDAEYDYGVAWLQSNVDARNGWCAKRVASDVLLPEGVGVHAFDPKGPTEIDSIRKRTTRLTADAAGMATEPARVTQDWIAYPARVKGLYRDQDGVFRVKWVGSTKAKLGFAGGVEISWPPGAPPDGLSYQLNFALGSPDAC